MNALIVTAHPEVKSFNFALRNIASRILESEGIEVQVSDLYQMPFMPAAGAADFRSYAYETPLQLMKAQAANKLYGGYRSDILEEQAKLTWADLIIFQFPIWWGTYPAVLKGWMERVLTYGFAYGGNKELQPKSALLTVTTGGARDKKEEHSYKERIDRMTGDVFGFMGWEIHTPFIVHGPSYLNEEERILMLKKYENYLKNCIKSCVINNPAVKNF